MKQVYYESNCLFNEATSLGCFDLLALFLNYEFSMIAFRRVLL